MKLRNYCLPIIFSIFISLTSFGQTAIGNSTSSTTALRPVGPKLMVLKMHADWCATCKAMGPVFEDLTKKLAEKPVLFAKFDLTDKGTKNQAIQLAASLGIMQVARENQATGFILIVDPVTKTVIQKLTKDDNLEAMISAIEARLAN